MFRFLNGGVCEELEGERKLGGQGGMRGRVRAWA